MLFPIPSPPIIENPPARTPPVIPAQPETTLHSFSALVSQTENLSNISLPSISSVAVDFHHLNSQPSTSACFASQNDISNFCVEPLLSTAANSSQTFPTSSLNVNPLFTTTTTSNAGQITSSIENWAQNLISPHQSQLNSLNQYGLRDPDLVRSYRESIFSPNQLEPHSHYSNVSLPPFYNSKVELWFATAEHTFAANGIFNKYKRFSMVTKFPRLKFIQKVQHIVRLPSNHLYLDIEKALTKTCKLNENHCLDILLNKTEIDDRKPIEMLNEMRQLLEAYDVTNSQTNAVLRRLFLDKLPAQVITYDPSRFFRKRP